MRPTVILLLLASAVLGLSSCMKETERKPVPPGSETSRIPWNSPVSGQGQGQLGMMDQNRYRR